jgi:hypothetical protein
MLCRGKQFSKLRIFWIMDQPEIIFRSRWEDDTEICLVKRSCENGKWMEIHFHRVCFGGHDAMNLRVQLAIQQRVYIDCCKNVRWRTGDSWTISVSRRKVEWEETWKQRGGSSPGDLIRHWPCVQKVRVRNRPYSVIVGCDWDPNLSCRSGRTMEAHS